MTGEHLIDRFRSLTDVRLARPGIGKTAVRHDAIFAAGREDLSLAKLIEAHWDAVAILEEAGKEPKQGIAYAVWASELPGKPLSLRDGMLHGQKDFCSGATLVDRALVTAGPVIVEIDLNSAPSQLTIREDGWKTEAFRMTHTASLTFDHFPIVSIVGDEDWYTKRVGFWQGACGPAAAWAGGAAGLVDYAFSKRRDEPHSMAHLGAMSAEVIGMEYVLTGVAEHFDAMPTEPAMIRALTVRHLVEAACTDILQRFGRSLGAAPFVKDVEVARRYAELELYLRQCHAERDLESLGRALNCIGALPGSNGLFA